MSEHKTTVTTVRRKIHDIARIVLIVRCNGCKYRSEHHDEARAHMEARRHEVAVSVAGAVEL